MKKDFLKYILVMFLAVSFASCEDDDDKEIYYDSAVLSLSETEFTILDSELATEIDFMSTTKTVTNVSIEVDGNEISSGTATGNKYSFTLDRSNFGVAGDTLDGSFRAYVYATVDGKVKEMYTTFEMVPATSLRIPFVEDVDEDGEGIEVDEPIYELSDVVKNFTYKVSPKTATDIAVTASLKLNSEEYTELWTKDYDSEDLDWSFMGSDYTKGDTLNLMLIAKVGTFVDTVTSSIIVSEYLLGATSSIQVDVDMPGYDLVGDSVIDIAETACNIKFTHDYANLEQGITGLNSTSFVLVDAADEDLMAATNLPLLKSAFDAGTAVMVLDNVVADEKYIVKYTKGADIYYGIIVITETNQVRDGDMDFVMMDYALEMYDEQQ
ncbi:hypothetical protein [Ancylomarina sp. 16SWW S1-10-2]|uniref:hypothetical protein n=1 Tax=Ancylomarina sp. 16SWW S1-10-2 TaxID=2499681 RepID=UPI0012ADB16D|nr:hypothetical protein [Ancylomarina sp. 16SWW S1-10-2]MRT93329.1 hypothetical protein [Ancylomarina sp. 16SWW S1-10-2]